MPETPTGEKMATSTFVGSYLRRLLFSPGWFGILVVLLDLVFIYLAIVKSQSALYQEDALMENMQAGAMVVSAACLIVAGFRAGTGLSRWLLGVFALTCWAFFLRELDVEDLDVHPILIAMGSGTGRDVSIGLGYVVLGILFWKYFRHHTRRLPGVFHTRTAMVVLVGCVFLGLGGVFEPLGMMFWEELVELNGSLLIFLGACLCLLDPENLARNVVRST